jgi:CheY-like chemotaxis protein
VTAPAAHTVLVAEDYSDFRARILALLEPLDVACVPAKNGREAIEVVRDLSRELHLLITDMDMPVHTGWEVIAAVREHRGVDLPIIMQTGEANYSYVRRRANEFGIVLIDKKEIDELLVPAVRQALGISEIG